MRQSRWRSAYGFAALALAVAGCGSSGSSNGSGGGGNGGNTIAGLSANNHGEQDVTGKTDTTIQASNFYFSPSVLKGSPGQALMLHIKNTGSTPHNITVANEKVDSIINSNATVTVQVTFPTTGILSFWCSFHKSNGMAGGLLTSGSIAGTSGSSGSGSSPASSTGSGGYGGYGGG